MIAAVADTVPPRAAAASQFAADRTASRWFVHLAFIGCICLQRFCVYVGGSPVYVCLPMLLLLLGWLLATGRAELRPLSVALYTGIAVVGLISSLVAVNTSDPRILSVSIASLLAFLILYLGLTLRPTARFDTSRTFAIFLFYVRLCAVLGIAQYLLQFAGIRMFSFLVMFPALKPILVEPLFNYLPVVSYGSPLFRSNGFFLVEPSIFSQLLMLGVLVEFFIVKRWIWLPLYGVAYVFTYAGTGILALVAACAVYILVAPRDGLRIAAFVGVAAVLALIGGLVFPEQFAAMLGRTSELNYAGSSGYARYASQLDMFAAVEGETRSLIGYGPGSLERAKFYTPGGSSPTLKLYVDYGILGVLTFTAFFVNALWRLPIAVVSLFILINFQLGGGNLLFAPFVVMGAILCIWSASPTAARR